MLAEGGPHRRKLSGASAPDPQGRGRASSSSLWRTEPQLLSPHPPRSPSMSDGDNAAGTKRSISLADSGLLSQLCACVPALILFPSFVIVLITPFSCEPVFFAVSAALSAYMFLFSLNLIIPCGISAFRIRRDVRKDYHAMLKDLQEQCPETRDMMHIILLPNYKEDVDMLQHTLENIARNAIAGESVNVVLCMEEREGAAARDKAAKLIDQNRHLFADIFATFHPENLPGDLPGKSSNTQWAYRQVLQRFAPQLSKIDSSKVFLTVADADTLLHPQYLSALSYNGLCMSTHERSWSIWQPPILLLRNLMSAPAPIRVSSYGTILFELAGLSSWTIAPHFCFSAYSMTLALASHHFVNGWDRDVIAEDHHMFCKCYFASIWEQLTAVASGKTGSLEENVTSHLMLRPIFLPAVSYLVVDEGFISSIRARFVQARRHSQGVAEMSYALLHYGHVLLTGHARHLTWYAHYRILAITAKMASVHLISTVHALATVVATVLIACRAIQWIFSQNYDELLEHGVQGAASLQSFAGLKWGVCAVFGPVPPLAFMMSAVTYIVVKDTLEGKMTSDPAKPRALGPNDPAAPDVEGSSQGPGGLGPWQRFKLLLLIQHDWLNASIATLIIFGTIPAVLSVWSLLTCKGASFVYIVAPKPNDSNRL